MILEASVKSLENTNDKLIIKALAVTDKYISPSVIDSVVKYAVNQPIIYRHVHPASPGEGEILGNVIHAEKVDVEGANGVEITAEFMKYTPYQQKAAEYVIAKQEKKDPIKISIGLQEYGIDGKAVDGRPFEFSLTRIPVCDECATHEVITMEKKEIDKDAKIAELETALDEAVKKNTSLANKVSTLEDATKKIDQGIATTADTIKKEYDGILHTMKQKLESVEKELDLAKRMPVIEQIMRLEKDPYMEKFYVTETLENLKLRLEEVKKKNPAGLVTQTMEESRAAVTDKSLEDKLKADVMNNLKQDPTLAKILFGNGLTDAERGVGW